MSPLHNQLDEEQTQLELRQIARMSHIEMARLYRFAIPGHPYFNTHNPELVKAFATRYNLLGGMTPAISKLIGWE